MNKNPKNKTDRPALRPLFIAELGSVAGGRWRPDIITTRSSLEGGSDSASE